MKYVILSDAQHQTTLNNGTVLSRVLAVKDFADVKAGSIGGYIEKAENLSQEGNCWVYDNAKVSGNAVVTEDAQVYDEAQVSGKAHIRQRAQVCGKAVVTEDAKVSNYMNVYGNAVVKGSVSLKGDYSLHSDVVVSEMPWILITPDIQAVWTDHHITTNNCFTATFEEFKKLDSAAVEKIAPGAAWLFKRYEEIFTNIIDINVLSDEEIKKLQDETLKSLKK